ncbi:MAG: hypothetical protein IKA65_01760 [Lentisphaeria bacterium]|nr:hypothetical protein [Lentisphaeria bacterium]
MKFSKYYVLAAALAVCCAGCSSTVDKQSAAEKSKIAEITGLEVQSAVAEGRNMGEALLAAIKSKDFARTANIPVGDEKNRLTQDKFNKILKNLEKAGGISQTAYLGDLALGAYRRLLWKVSFNGAEKAPANDMIFEIVIVKFNNQYRIAGFGFRP